MVMSFILLFEEDLNQTDPSKEGSKDFTVLRTDGIISPEESEQPQVYGSQ